jgi:osmotically-inducible protein OsmY
MKIMKIRVQAHSLVICGILPFFLLAAGCKDKGATSDSNGTTTMADADNSAKNVRDRNDATLTPGDQGNSPADREITQRIRKALMDASGYSGTAKNIKIITADGKVTLRGPVKTDAEKMGIVTIAKSAAGEANVEDQLEVKANP